MALSIPSFFEAFRGAPQGKSPQGPPPGTPGTGTGASGAPGVAPNGMIPPGGGATGAGNPAAPGTESNAAPGGAPVDPWTSMWDTAAKSQQGAEQPTSLFDIKPEQINEASGKMNFVQGLQPELVQKALSGDVNAFMQVINGVGQRIYAQTSYAGMRLMDAGINKFSNNFTEKELPKHFQNFTADHALRGANPVFKDPKYAPMLETFKRALVSANPQASPQEIQATAEQYLQSLVSDASKVSSGNAGAGNPGAAPGASASGSNLVVKDANGNEDWSNYFGSPMPGAQQF